MNLLNLNLPITAVAIILVQACGLFWWAAGQSNDISNVQTELNKINGIVTVEDLTNFRRDIKDLNRLIADIDDTVEELEKTVELIERDLDTLFAKRYDYSLYVE
jgi:uncharacterized protein HemX